MMIRKCWMMVVACVWMSCNAGSSNQDTGAGKTPAEKGCNFCNVSPEEFQQRMQNTPGQVLDVRTAAEVSEGRISGAVNIDINTETFTAEMQKLDKAATVYVYCAAGGRSSRAMQWMKENGFTAVVNLDGGMHAWQAASLPVEQ